MHTSRIYLIVAGLVLAMASGAQAQTKEWHGLTFKTLTAETAEENSLLVFDGAGEGVIPKSMQLVAGRGALPRNTISENGVKALSGRIVTTPRQ